MQQFAQNRERTNRVIDGLRAIAKQAGHSPAQIALAWLRHRKSPVIPIIGARRLDQLEANVAIVDLKLPAEDIRALDEASQIELGFPHDFLDKPMVKAFTFGGTRDLIDAQLDQPPAKTVKQVTLRGQLVSFTQMEHRC